MPITLGELASNAVRNGIMQEKITDVSDLPKRIRIRVFNLMRMKHWLDDEICIRLFSRSGFFDGFRCISMFAEEEEDWSTPKRNIYAKHGAFLEFLMRCFHLNPASAEKIVELGLAWPGYLGYEEAEGPLIEFERRMLYLIPSLVIMCPNLKRLRLHRYNADGLQLAPLDTVYELYDEITYKTVPQVVHMQLINPGVVCVTSVFKELFLSLRSLTLVGLVSEDCLDSLLLQCCGNTLEYLALDEVQFDAAVSFPLFPGILHKLRRIYLHTRPSYLSFDFVRTSCPKLEMIYAKFDVDQMIVDYWNDLFQFPDMRLELNVRHMSELTGQAIEQIGSVVRTLTADGCGLRDDQWNRLGRYCTNLRVLAIDSMSPMSDEFLRKLCGIPTRANALVELVIRSSISYETLRTVFSNCLRLQRLIIDSSANVPRHQIDVLLRNWARNGARPKLVCLSGFETISSFIVCEFLQIVGPCLNFFRVKIEDSDYDICLKAAVNNCPMISTFCPNIGEHLAIDVKDEKLFLLHP